MGRSAPSLQNSINGELTIRLQAELAKHTLVLLMNLQRIGVAECDPDPEAIRLVNSISSPPCSVSMLPCRTTDSVATTSKVAKLVSF